MQCNKCKVNEAVYTCDCIVVKTNTTTSYHSGHMYKNRTEWVAGIRRFGVCQDCINQAVKKADLPDWMVPIVGIGGLIGGLSLINYIVGILSGQLDFAMIVTYFCTGIAPFAAVVAGCLIGARIINKKTAEKRPYLFFGSTGSDDVLVPVGDGFYRNQKDFEKQNQGLSGGMRKKIYENLIVSGGWKRLEPIEEIETSEGKLNRMAKMVMEAQQAQQPVLPDDGSTLNRCVNRLFLLYQKKPEGYLTQQAYEVRAIGEELDREGGMELMLKAHQLFSQHNPRMARNLEMVWDHIGNWQG